MRPLGTALVLAALWLLMSGLFDTLILIFGACSIAVTVWVVRRMDAVDGDQVEIALKPLKFSGYILWLLWEIAKANWNVTRIILSPAMPIRQHLFRVPFSQRTDLGQVIFANSITVTPGTISIETEPGFFLVHAVAYSPDDLVALADMDARITATESGGM